MNMEPLTLLTWVGVIAFSIVIVAFAVLIVASVGLSIHERQIALRKDKVIASFEAKIKTLKSDEVVLIRNNARAISRDAAEEVKGIFAKAGITAIVTSSEWGTTTGQTENGRD